MPFYHKARCRAVYGTPCGDTLMPYGNIKENRALFDALPTLNTSLRLAAT